MRQSTLDTLGLGNVIDIFERGEMPAQASDLVDAVFGDKANRGSLVVSGANGIVGAGKTMQLGSRLEPFGVPVVALDFAGAPDGIGRQYKGLVRAFGRERADRIMQNIVRMTYDGRSLPANLGEYNPRFLLEAIPEILDAKKAHYDIFREQFPDIHIKSVTSGFPSTQLGVAIAHPAFPHEINKIWEVVESEPSDVTRLMWALGMIPVPVSDDWSFVLDVLFCGLTNSASRYHEASNMPYWKIDKYIRKFMGPNPFRAHDAIGAKGANFLTWSCLHHLEKEYGAVFAPTRELTAHKDAGSDWYPPNHFRPLVNWTLDDDEQQDLKAWVLGPLLQMTSLMLHEKRAHLSHMNIIGELCAQFNRGTLAAARSLGPERAVQIVEAYHARHPEAAKSAWHPEAFSAMGDAEWQQLYVNAEYRGDSGVITIGRESYNSDVDAELNRAIDWLKQAGIDRVVVSGDFHLATQMVGADTTEFFAALESESAGYDISYNWSKTARRLNDEFATSVGFVDGKRCWGGYLELMLHCHFLVAVEDATLAFPEVTLPVVPGMEGTHWPFRKASKDDWPRIAQMLLDGRPVAASDAVGWMADYAGPMQDALKTAWKLANGDEVVTRRAVVAEPLDDVAAAIAKANVDDDPALEPGRRAIADTIRAATEANLAEALEIQAKHSAAFMISEACRTGSIGGAYTKTVKI